MGEHKSPAFSRFGTSGNRDNKEMLYLQPTLFLQDTEEFIQKIDEEITSLKTIGGRVTPK